MSKRNDHKLKADEDPEVDVLITPRGWRIVHPDDPELPDLRNELDMLTQKGDEESIRDFLSRHEIDGVIRKRKWHRQSRYKSYQ